MKILVADDEEPCRTLVQDLFATDPTVEITMARDGAEAWWFLSDPARKFDIGLFDVKMPVVDGIQLLERVHSDPALRHLPVILCTGVSDRDTVAKAARLGISSYIVKPYNPRAMRAKIQSLVA